MFTFFYSIIDNNLDIFYKKAIWMDFNGEPLVDPYFFDRIAYMHSKGINTRISTNGALLNEENRLKIAKSGISYLVVSIGLLLGILFIIICENIYKIILNKNNKELNSSKKRCMLLISAISFHNIPEGLIIGFSYGSLIYNTNAYNIMASIGLTIAIALQNFPEGIAVSLPLRKEGYTRKKAFFYGQLSAIVEPIGATIGALLVMKIEKLLPFLLAMAAGAMLFVIISDLIPESQKNSNKSLITIITIIGFLIMMILDTLLG